MKTVLTLAAVAIGAGSLVAFVFDALWGIYAIPVAIFFLVAVATPE